MAKQPSQEELYGEVLTSSQQYRKDLGRRVALSEQQETALLDQAKQGSVQARDALISSCLHYVQFVAYKFADRYNTEMMTLIGEGNLALIENFEKALESKKPMGYLRKCACGRMIRYALCYGRSLIRTPEGTTGARPNPIPVDSFDVPAFDEEGCETLLGRLLVEPEMNGSSEEDYQPLYQATEALGTKQRDVIVRHYGMYDAAPQPPHEIAEELYPDHPNKKAALTNVLTHKRVALQRMRQQLTCVETPTKKPAFSFVSPSRSCPVCGQTFTPTMRSQLYDRRKCTQKALDERKKAKKGVPVTV